MNKTAPVKKKGKTKPRKKSGAVKVVWNPEQPLNIAEEMFCQYYVLNEDTRRNATMSYAIAYGRMEELEKAPKDDAVYENDDVMDEEGENDVKKTHGRGKCIQASSYDRLYNVCSNEGARLVRKPYISRRVTELLNSLLRDEIVDAELAKVIMQDRELSPKMRAVEEFNKLRQRTTKTTVEHEFGNVSPDVSVDDLDAFIENGMAFFKKKKVVPKK